MGFDRPEAGSAQGSLQFRNARVFNLKKVVSEPNDLFLFESMPTFYGADPYSETDPCLVVGRSSYAARTDALMHIP